MQQNATPRTLLGELTALPQTLAGFKGPLRGEGGEGREGGREREREERGREGRGGAEVDSDAQLEQGRRLAKAGPGQPNRWGRITQARV